VQLEEAEAMADEDRRAVQVKADAARRQARQIHRFNRALQREQQLRLAEEQALDARVVAAALNAHEEEAASAAHKKVRACAVCCVCVAPGI
jgi:hypothetical protein